MKMSLQLILISIFLISFSEARIVNRKVKEAPKTCTIMKEDIFLSRPQKIILGTLRNSIIINDEIKLVNDLGKKICEWPKEPFLAAAPVNIFEFYIDEYKNILIPYAKKETGYVQFKINLSNCEFEEQKEEQSLVLPKCEPPKKKRSTIKRKKTA
jgi:hypothetical protein